MQRRILFFLLILAHVGFILARNEAGFNVEFLEENGVGLRKLLQEKTKLKASKSGKAKTKGPKAKEGEVVLETQETKKRDVNGKKETSGASKKDLTVKKRETNEGMRDLDGIQKTSSRDGIQERTSKKGKKGKTGKEKRALDEEDDEDIRFMEEEKKLQGDSEDGKVSINDSKKDEKPSSTEIGKKQSLKKTGEKDEEIREEQEEKTTEQEDGGKAAEDEDKMSGKEDKLSENEEEKPLDESDVEQVKLEEKKNMPLDEGEDSSKIMEHSDTDDIIPVNIEDENVENKENVEKKEEEAAHEIKEEKESSGQKKPSTQKGLKVDDKEKGKETTGLKKPSKETDNNSKGISKTKLDKSKPKKPTPDTNVANKTNVSMNGGESKKNAGVEKNDKLSVEKTESSSKKDQIPLHFSAGEDVEDLQTDAAMTKAGVGDILDEDEEDMDFIHEFQNLPTKLQETAGHVADTLLPGIEKSFSKSKEYLSHASQHIGDGLAPIMGKQVAPVVASLISYSLLLIPLIVVLYTFERIRATLSLAKVLFFINVYLAAYFVTLVLATFALRVEPMALFFENSRSSCVFLQLLQAFGFFFYILLYTIVFIKSCSHGFLERLISAFQWVIVALFGLHYYVTVFHRVMAMKTPVTTWKVYCVYFAAFAVLALFARAKIEPTKKEYYYSRVDDPDEVVPVDKRS